MNNTFVKTKMRNAHGTQTHTHTRTRTYTHTRIHTHTYAHHGHTIHPQHETNKNNQKQGTMTDLYDNIMGM